MIVVAKFTKSFLVYYKLTELLCHRISCSKARSVHKVLSLVWNDMIFPETKDE